LAGPIFVPAYINTIAKMILRRAVKQRLAYGGQAVSPLLRGVPFNDDTSRPDARLGKPGIRIVGGTLVRLEF
jgi:hypothetical protein